MTNKFPLISIITSTYNCSEALLETLNSIKNQTYINIQWIVVDGLSTDGTISIIKNNLDIINKCVIEKDNGIYDAWNKAIKYIKGDWVLFLGAGDIFHSPDSLNILVLNFPQFIYKYDLLYCNVFITKKNGDIRYLCRKINLNYFENGRIALPNHQGVLHSNKCFKDDNPFDSKLKIAGDSKFLMQILKKGEIKHIDYTLTHMKDDGVSNNFKNILIARKEINQICKELNYNIPLKYKITAYLNDYFLILYNLILPKILIKQFRRIFDFIKV
jgi:glycosyltransferase involved in cell wall biosynthesis